MKKSISSMPHSIFNQSIIKSCQIKDVNRRTFTYVIP